MIFAGLVFTHSTYFTNLLSYFIPYALGIGMIRLNYVKKFIKSNVLCIVCIATYIGGLVFFFDFHNTSATTQIIRIGLSLCIIVIVEHFHKMHIQNIGNNPSHSIFAKALCLLGQNSMVIYLIHDYMLPSASRLTDNISNTLLQNCAVLVVSLFISLICTGTSLILKKCPHIYRILL